MANGRKTYAVDYIKGDFDKAQYLPDPYVDNLTAAVIGLGTEFWAMRRRLMVVESLLAKNAVVTSEAVEGYQPTDAEAKAWDAERDDMIDRVFAILGRVPVDTAGANPLDKVAPLTGGSGS